MRDWMNLTDEEKRKYNGYSGFVSGKKYVEDNAFLTLYSDRLERRRLRS